MTTISAGYLGGHPDHSKRIDDGRLVLDDGALRYQRETAENMLRRTVTIFQIPTDAITGASEAGDKVRRKGSGMAFVIAGPAGMAAHRATKGRQTHPLSIAVDHDGRAYTCRFVAGRPNVERLLRILGAAAAAPGDDAIAQLERLASLRDAGAITDEEFAAKKAELLERV